MPTTPSVNMQQIFQMGTHTEKLQQTIQTLPNITAQQLDKAREKNDELKRLQVQDIDPLYVVEETYPKTSKKKSIRVLKKNQTVDEYNKPPLPEDPGRGKINIVA